MSTGPSAKLEIPVPAASEARLDKENKSTSVGPRLQSHNLKVGGSLSGPVFPAGLFRSRRPGTQALSQLYKKARADTKGEAPPGPALLGNGGDRVPVALERKPGLADQEKAIQSDESLRPRTPTPSLGPPFHSPAHAHTHKHQASKFHFVWLVCPRSHLATFPVPASPLTLGSPASK